ncbi:MULTISPECIES: DUF2510 domain-containing protein [unclassified Luteococcus]|uniref:DUF2510 domain-containing protein n=1 Tax=unclassified Luteococcus TaxID=2639923 RepID=UPI00313DD61C
MSMPGWYPDPAGAPGRFRYWDGSAWSAETTDNPGQTRPVAFAAPTGGRDERGGKGPLIALLAGLLVLALLVWALFFRGSDGFKAVPEDTNSASPTGPVWNETDTPTPTPSGVSEPAPTGGAMVNCPTGGGEVTPHSGNELRGGGLVIPAASDWADASSMSFSLPWTRDMQAQTKEIYRSGGTSWFSVQAVGAVNKSDGFTEVRNSARMMMSCFATSGYYSGYIGRKDLVTEAVTIDGKQGWHLRSEVYVEMEGLPQVPGDVIDVVVVDTGSTDTMGIFVSSATIGDQPVQGVVDSAREAMKLG